MDIIIKSICIIYIFHTLTTQPLPLYKLKLAPNDNHQLSSSILFVYFLQVVKKPPRNWKDIKCQKILKYGGVCQSVAIKGNHIAVGVDDQINVYDRSSTDLLHTIGQGQLGNYLAWCHIP